MMITMKEIMNSELTSRTIFVLNMASTVEDHNISHGIDIMWNYISCGIVYHVERRVEYF